MHISDTSDEGATPTIEFPVIDEVRQAVSTQFAKWTGANDTLRRLCAIT